MRVFLSVLFLLTSTITLSQACSPAIVPITNAIASDSSWIDTMNNRVDIIENQQGATLSLYLRIINRTAVAEACTNAEDAGAPMDYSVGLLNNAQVDIWQVNATGSYSDNLATTWLRGYQVTNTTGQVTFNTIFPAWTVGHTTHINVRVRISDTNSGFVQDDTTQLFFDDAISTSIYAAFASLYPTYGTRDIYNNNDTNFSDNLLMTVTGNDVDGYEASIDLMYPFTVVTDVPTTTTDDATTDMPTNAPTAITDATTTPPIDNSTTDIPTDMPTDIPTDTPPTTSSTGVTNANAASPWLITSMIPILLIEMVVTVVA